jgi:phosphopantetheinyl transferase (holo-ACP synthase)
VDAERVGGVGDELLPRLFDEDERARLLAMSADERRIAAALGFSAKEACFKAWGARFGDIHIEWGAGVFAAQSATGAHEGRFLVAGDLVLTAVFIPV